MTTIDNSENVGAEIAQLSDSTYLFNDYGVRHYEA